MAAMTRSFIFVGAGTRDETGKKMHYKTFVCNDGRTEQRVSVGDTVNCFAESPTALPYVGLVTAAWLSYADGAMYFRTQWFYRGAEIKKLLPDEEHKQVSGQRGLLWPVYYCTPRYRRVHPSVASDGRRTASTSHGSRGWRWRHARLDIWSWHLGRH
jgi:hypothetical protein